LFPQDFVEASKIDERFENESYVALRCTGYFPRDFAKATIWMQGRHQEAVLSVYEPIFVYCRKYSPAEPMRCRTEGWSNNDLSPWQFAQHTIDELREEALTEPTWAQPENKQ
jgi:hypothetical protein